MNKKTIFAVIGGLALCFGVFKAMRSEADTYTPILTYPDPQFCNAPVDTAILLADSGPTLVPFNPASGRRFVTICNSKENVTSTSIVKCGIAPMPTFRDAGVTIYDAGCIAIPGVCYHDGGPSCGSTTTYNNVDGGPVLADAGCVQAIYVDGGPMCPGPFGSDGGPCLVDGGPYDAGFVPDASCPLVDAGALLDGGFIDAGYTRCFAQCAPAWTLTGAYNWKDGGFTFNDGGPCLADAGYCLVDGGPVIVDAGITISDAGWVYQDGGPYLGAGSPGDVLGVGDCITYPIGTGQQPVCIGTNNNVIDVQVKECR